ncbi:hypothetical protein [Dysgonomonas sp. 25]|uniref:hypothetical protein n=1 Tax=Dysgonomonas sp. 25 TaxID=2302933 RepID=UPI0013D3D533|nr:hypothetical protein [Dysgonomonas sp. 25]NDV67888.1 hypothetical protein [Dysgonomonas sp. 25]
MKRLLILILILYGILNYNKNIPNTDYVKYKTFDEYSMQGVEGNISEGDYFVSIKEIEDSIIVISSLANEFGQDRYVYIDKGNYWYSQNVTRVPYIENCACDTTITSYHHKYIYNDTIISYNYALVNKTKQALNVSLQIKTRYTIISIDLSNRFDQDSEDLFLYFKHIAKEYNILYQNRRSDDYYEANHYTYYNKRMNGDTLFVYEKDLQHSEYQLGCLYDVRILNSLGEFDPYKGESIMSAFSLPKCE